jgi:hypothetical protein
MVFAWIMLPIQSTMAVINGFMALWNGAATALRTLATS